MPKVICTLPNASESINGVKFVSHARGMISEDLDDDTATAFLAIPGYEPQHKPVDSVTPDAPQDPALAEATSAAAAQAAAQLEQLRARAKDLGIARVGTMGIERLSREIEDAERAAAAAQQQEQQKA